MAVVIRPVVVYVSYSTTYLVLRHAMWPIVVLVMEARSLLTLAYARALLCVCMCVVCMPFSGFYMCIISKNNEHNKWKRKNDEFLYDGVAATRVHIFFPLAFETGPRSLLYCSYIDKYTHVHTSRPNHTHLHTSIVRWTIFIFAWGRSFDNQRSNRFCPNLAPPSWYKFDAIIYKYNSTQYRHHYAYICTHTDYTVDVSDCVHSTTRPTRTNGYSRGRALTITCTTQIALLWWLKCVSYAFPFGSS